MGFYDRDYARPAFRSAGILRGMPAWSVTTWLIVINVVVYVIDQLSGGLLSLLGYFSEATAVHHFQIWRFITFQFLHAGLGHLFFNMLALYFFGPLIEQFLGSRRYTIFYLVCGVAGAVMYLVLWRLGLLFSDPRTPLVGASAGIFGVLIAAARIAPDAQVMLLFPPIPMRLKTLAWVMLGIAVLMVFSNGPNAGGQAAHLGGAAAGAALIWNPRALDLFSGPRIRGRRRRFFSDDWR